MYASQKHLCYSVLLKSARSMTQVCQLVSTFRRAPAGRPGFIRGAKVNRIVPMSIEQGIRPIYQVSVQFKEGAVHCHEALQKDHTSFANDWMVNLAEQQNLD